MKNFIYIIVAALIAALLYFSSNFNRSNSNQSNFSEHRQIGEDMLGKKIDTLINEFGSPDGIYPRSNFQVLWDGPDAKYALNYIKFKKRVFITEDCTIVCVSPIVK